MKYWSVTTVMPYQRRFNFINGKRRIGKTYTAQKWLIKKCIKDRVLFCCLLRRKKEISEWGFRDWLEKVVDREFQGCEFVINKTQMFYKTIEQVEVGEDKDGNPIYEETENLQLIGICLALSDAEVIKKKSYPRVKYVVFDEYMLPSNRAREYVNGWAEPDLFLNIYDTIDRGENRAICFLFGNNTTFYNPYHMHKAFRIPKLNKGQIWMSENVLFHWVDENNLEHRESAFDRMIKGTEYGNMALGENYYDDTDMFLEARSKKATHKFAFDYLGSTFGVWSDNNAGKIYIDSKWDSGCVLHYALTLEDHNENTLLTKGNTHMLKWLATGFKLGCVRFVSPEVRAKAEGAMRLIV